MNIDQSALLLIDLQKEDNFGLQNIANVIHNAQKLIAVCRQKNIPIIYTRQINRSDSIGLSLGEPVKEDGRPVYYASGTENAEILDELKPLEKDIIIDKHRWSAFYETNLDLLLRSMGIKHLIIGGLVTDGCLITSLCDAYFRDYDIHLVKDICATSNEGAHMASILIMANWVYNIKIYDTDNMINRLRAENYSVWQAQEPDSLQFTPENMREMFNKLTKK